MSQPMLANAAATFNAPRLRDEVEPRRKLPVRKVRATGGFRVDESELDGIDALYND